MQLSSATHMLAAARAEAERLGVVVCVSIVDAAGYLVVFLRMDGLALGCIDVCHKKARTAALFHMDSAAFAQVACPGGGAYSLEQTNGGLTSFGGGLAIRDKGGVVIGGIGVSGARTEDDIAIGRVALAAFS